MQKKKTKDMQELLQGTSSLTKALNLVTYFKSLDGNLFEPYQQIPTAKAWQDVLPACWAQAAFKTSIL